MGGVQNWHRRLALQLAAQLPDDPDDARKIVEYLKEILEFLNSPDRPEPPDGGGQGVLRFPGGANAPSDRARSTGSPSALPK